MRGKGKKIVLTRRARPYADQVVIDPRAEEKDRRYIIRTLRSWSIKERAEWVENALPAENGDPIHDDKRRRCLELAQQALSGNDQALKQAELLAREMALLPLVRRDKARQQGTIKPRGSRMPQLDSWIKAALEREPDATWKELWQRLATENTDHDPVYVDGDRDRVCEWDDAKERNCGERAFQNRITEARKNK